MRNKLKHESDVRKLTSKDLTRLTEAGKRVMLAALSHRNRRELLRAAAQPNSPETVRTSALRVVWEAYQEGLKAEKGGGVDSVGVEDLASWWEGQFSYPVPGSSSSPSNNREMLYGYF